LTLATFASLRTYTFPSASPNHTGVGTPSPLRLCVTSKQYL